MTPSEFCYWLQGWAELEDGKTPKMEQWKLILEHLSLVFNKVTPSLEDLMTEGSGLFYESDLPESEEEDSEMPPYRSELTQEDRDAAMELMRKAAENQKDSSGYPPLEHLFSPPSCTGRPPALSDDQLICSNGEKPNSPQYCLSAASEPPAPPLPRKVRGDK